jgi:hypothetical protein
MSFLSALRHKVHFCVYVCVYHRPDNFCAQSFVTLFYTYRYLLQGSAGGKESGSFTFFLAVASYTIFCDTVGGSCHIYRLSLCHCPPQSLDSEQTASSGHAVSA